MAVLLPPMYTHSTYWLWAAGFYLLAKVEEAVDKPIYSWTHHIVSGHTIKHLFAAMVPVFFTIMLAKRSIETNRGQRVERWSLHRPKNQALQDAGAVVPTSYEASNHAEAVELNLLIS
ncbi:hypothetical protein POM88_041675 [Heracleum sosnowskyi]|uniref:Alkaline ceramidase n=1 Tax=Heracleum sosnowskyi TaxID=360622 RepID=A0AAD8HFC0_9APIA|nr:hypothetical protein POM88_041675 [Heracleum sosnowskyi]